MYLLTISCEVEELWLFKPLKKSGEALLKSANSLFQAQFTLHFGIITLFIQKLTLHCFLHVYLNVHCFPVLVSFHQFTIYLDNMKVYFNQYGEEKPTKKSQNFLY